MICDGEEALRFVDSLQAQGSRPDIILLDLNLPKRDGDEGLRRLRNSGQCGDIPVIVLTSSDSIADRRRVAELGANGYFRKPSRFDDFIKLGDLVQKTVEISSGFKI